MHINYSSSIVQITYHAGPEIDDPDMRDQNPQSLVISQSVSEFLQKHFIGIKKNCAIMEACLYTVTVSSQHNCNITMLYFFNCQVIHYKDY